MIRTSAIDEIVDFIAKQNLNQVLAFKASNTTKSRVFTLINKSKTAKLGEKEQAELDNYFLLEHLMRLAKIKAYQILHL